jgi:hypothetical protein
MGMLVKCKWYHDTQYDPNMIEPITQEYCNKPKGGLWTSPVISEWNWEQWCECEEPHWIIKKYTYYFTIDTTNILIIDSWESADKLPRVGEGSYREAIDYEKIAKKYKGIWVKPFDGWRFRNRPFDFYVWDVDTVLIFDPSCITQVEIEIKK